MPTWSRAIRSSLYVAAVVALTQPGGGAPGVITSSPPPVAATAMSAGPVHRVSYHGVALDVPATWPVIDLQSSPGACVRLDRTAVYLGDPPAQQDCPAHAVGRADAIWLHPSAAAAPGRTRAFAARSTKVGALAAQVAGDPTGHSKRVDFLQQHVEVDTSWGPDSGVVDSALASATTAATSTTPTRTTTPTTPTRTATPASPAPAPSSPTPAPVPSSAPATSTSSPRAEAPANVDPATVGLMAATTSASSTFTGMAFDTCAAPAASTMKAWLASPYRGLGIYIGGSMRACPDGNLSASWVSTVKSMGWGLLPIYVGPQAPCVYQSGLATIQATQAAAQGKASADDAVSRAQYFGLAAGTPIYYDMEGYNSSVSGCTSTVLKFISAWSSELKARGYASGAYGSSASLMVDMSRAMGSSGFVPPTNVWFAHWNGLQNTSDAASYPAFADTYWTNHHRVHQYAGGTTQAWGGVSVNIDANWTDAQVGGVAVPVAYGTHIVGPGSAGFVFTGDMTYWRPNVPQGVKGMAYWTYSSGPKEYNGATWAPTLPPGIYSVQAYIPGTKASATAPYTVRYAGGSAVRTVNQNAVSGYVSLGNYLTRAGSPITVHVGDNDGTSTTTQLGVDAMAFRLVASAPGAPGSVTASGANHQATVSWSPAAANGSSITSYRVTASPGGASVTVSGSSTSAVVSGLTDGTTYTFSVSATNAVGSGPASAPSNPVTPHPASNAHDWNGDGHPDVLARDGAGYLWLYPGDGTGGFTPRRELGSGWNSMTAITTPGDWNGDGHPDVLARDKNGYLWLYPGNGTGGWFARREVGSGWNGMTAIATPGDWNGDGNPDILARDKNGYLWLYPSNGTGGWLPRIRYGSGWNAMTALVTPGDWNGDGHPDLLARDSAGYLWLYPSNGSGGWLPRQRFGSGWNAMTAFVTPGDWNGDGHPDVLARDSAGYLWLYPGNGTGGWLARRQYGRGWNAMTAID